MTYIIKIVNFIIWFGIILYLTVIIRVRLVLGKIPKYLDSPDPDQLNLGIHYILTGVLMIIIFFLIPLGLILLLIQAFMDFKKIKNLNILLFLLASIIYILIRFYFIETYLWFFD